MSSSSRSIVSACASSRPSACRRSSASFGDPPPADDLGLPLDLGNALDIVHPEGSEEDVLAAHEHGAIVPRRSCTYRPRSGLRGDRARSGTARPRGRRWRSRNLAATESHSGRTPWRSLRYSCSMPPNSWIARGSRPDVAVRLTRHSLGVGVRFEPASCAQTSGSARPAMRSVSRRSPAASSGSARTNRVRAWPSRSRRRGPRFPA